MMATIQDPTEIVQLDGELLSAEAPALLASLPGVLRGEGIFETFLVRDGVPTPRLAAHDARLVGSAERTGFDISSGELQASLRAFLPHLPPGRWRVRLTVLRGLQHRQHLLWTAGPQPAPQEEVVLQVSDLRVDPEHPLAGAKTTSRLEFQVARAKARQAGAFEALTTTVDGHLAEGTSCNVFLWLDGALHTPSMDCGILGGVTRDSLIQACREASIPLSERKIPYRELSQAVEVYVSNAVIGLVPVARIQDWNDSLPGKRGDQLLLLRRAYATFLQRLVDSTTDFET